MKRSYRVVFWIVGMLAWAMLGYSVVHAQNAITTGQVGPRGYTGPRGPAGLFRLGTVGTGDPGTPVIVNNTGTGSDAILNLIIPRGSVIYTGSGAPANAVGGNSDYYIDKVANCLYGPKTTGTGAWPGTCQPFAGSIGPAGPTGPTGATGPTGPPGSPSAGLLYDVQASDGNSLFVADTTGHKIKIDPTNHTMVTNINGKVNAQLYNISNNGASQALANTDCTGTGACTVYIPATYSGTETLPQPTNGNSTIESERNNARIVFKHNPGNANISATSLPYQNCSQNPSISECNIVVVDTPDPSATSIPSGAFNRGQTIWQKSWAWSYGNAPGAIAPVWVSAKNQQYADQWDSSGINQTIGMYATKHANGDVALIYGYLFSDGGADAYSDEGVEPMSLQGGETPDWFHGTVAVTAVAPTQLQASAVSNQRNTTTAGSFVINTSKAFNSGAAVAVTGASTPLFNTAGVQLTGYPQLLSMPIDAAVQPSSAYGPIKCEQDVNNSDPNIGQFIRSGDMRTKTAGNQTLVNTASCTVTIYGGANAGTGFTNGYALLSGDFPEGVTISNVGTVSAGTQTMTVAYRHPHGGELALPIGHAPVYPGSYTTIWQGQGGATDVTGLFVSIDKYLNSKGMKLIYRVYGAPDANHIVAGISTAAGFPTPYLDPSPLDNSHISITQLGTRVTAAMPNNGNVYRFNMYPTVRVAGCSSTAGINGTGTSVSVDFTSNSISWTTTATSTGSVTSICGGLNPLGSGPGNNVTLDSPVAEYQMHMYAGARLEGPSTAVPSTITLEPNPFTWTAGDVIEEPHHPTWSSALTQFVHLGYNPTPGKARTFGQVFNALGDMVGGTYKFARWGNGNPCSMYIGCGGKIEAPIFLQLDGAGAQDGVNEGAMFIQSAPLNLNSVISIGCLPTPMGGCNNKSPLYWLAYRGTAHSQLVYYPDTNEYGANIFSSGTEAGTKGISGQTNSSTRYNGGFRGSNIMLQGSESSSNNVGAMSSIIWSPDAVNVRSRLGQCSQYETSTNTISLGICRELYAGGELADGSLRLSNIEAQKQITATTVNATIATIGTPNGQMGSLAYSGTAGTLTRGYVYYYVTPLGLKTFYGAHTDVANTVDPLTTSSKVTITCPTTAQLPLNLAGSTIGVYTVPIPGSAYRDLGNCPINGTLVDDGTITATANPVDRNATMPISAGQFQVAAPGLAFYKSQVSTDAPDTFITREGTNTLRIGSTATAADGTLHLGTLNATTINGAIGVGGIPVDNSTIESTGSALKTKGFTGSCASTTTLTVLNGVITGCS